MSGCIAERIMRCLSSYARPMTRLELEQRLGIPADSSKHALVRLKRGGYITQKAPRYPYAAVPGKVYTDSRGKYQFGPRNPRNVEDTETILNARIERLKAEAPRTVPALDTVSLIASQLLR